MQSRAVSKNRRKDKEGSERTGRGAPFTTLSDSSLRGKNPMSQTLNVFNKGQSYIN